MTRASERHENGDARVIPVILRSCDWHHAPFGKLLAAPKDGKPVTRWTDRDEAFLDVANAIRKIAQRVAGPHPTAPARQPVTTVAPVTNEPRSSNLRLRKTYTEHDRDVFLEEAFEFMARFFENSLEELKARNPGYETAFKRIDATKFTAAIYRNGAALARCQIRLGGFMSNGIAFSYGNSLHDTGFNENLSVEVGEQALGLRPLGMQSLGASKPGNLSFEGAAEHYWELFIQPLQR